MLPLDDPLWSDLTHAYGSASDVPDLVRTLPHSLPDLSNRVLHQGEVAEAAFYVVPHLVALRATPGWHQVREEVLDFIGLVALEGGASRPGIPGYDQALEVVGELVLDDLLAHPDRAEHSLVTLAAVRGQEVEARVLRDSLLAGEQMLTCPHCWNIAVMHPGPTGWRFESGLEYR